MNKRIFLIALALVLAVACLTGCSKKSGGSSVASPEGSWVCQSMTTQGVTVTLEEGGETSVSLQFSSGGKFTMTTSAMGQTETVEGTWTFADGKGEMTVEGEAIGYTLEGDTLTMAADDNKAVFKRK